MNRKHHPARSPDHRRRPRRPRPRNGGFTLIEAALTTVIVGTGVLAIVAAQQAYHQKNNWAQRTGTGMLLANEIRERTLQLPFFDPITGSSNLGPETGENSVGQFDDLDDFAGVVDVNGHGAGTTINPPINALANAIPDLTQWTQRVQVDAVWPDNISAAAGGFLPGLDEPATLRRVTVSVDYTSLQTNQTETVTTLTWVVTE